MAHGLRNLLMSLLAQLGIPPRMRDALVPYWGIRWDLLMEEIQMLLTLVCQQARRTIDSGERICFDLMMEAVRDVGKGCGPVWTHTPECLPDIPKDPVSTSDSSTTERTEEDEEPPAKKRKCKPFSASDFWAKRSAVSSAKAKGKVTWVTKRGHERRFFITRESPCSSPGPSQ